MGTIVPRTRKDGSTAYMARIVITHKGKVAHRETKTFERRQVAAAWIAKREDELSKPGAIEAAKTQGVTLADAIDRYMREQVNPISDTSRHALNVIRSMEVGSMPCEGIEARHLVTMAQDIASEGRAPSTVATYMTYLANVFTLAKPAWGYPLDRSAMVDARAVASKLGIVSQSTQRERRPTLEELDKLMKSATRKHGNSLTPMAHIIAFAIFSTRRREEITRIRWDDLDEQRSRILVRDMKNPRRKKGNNVWCNLPPRAMQIIKAMPKVDDRIFPYNPETVTNSFISACDQLGIEGLRFHDMRHEGVSHLFELGEDIPSVATVSGHRRWTTLQRYAHIVQRGDKYANWKWLDVVTKPPPARRLRRVLCSGATSRTGSQPQQQAQPG